jgi:two-component system, NtrC family, response regulator HydG
LYCRINAYKVSTSRPCGDVALLAKTFLEKYTASHGKKLRGFTDKAKWPGNIRELQNTIERGLVVAQSGTRFEVSHLFSSYSDHHLRELGLDINGGLDMNRSEGAKALCEAAFNCVMTLDEVEGMLIATAVNKARGNLFSVARTHGLTRPQLGYRLKRLHEGGNARIAPALSNNPPAIRRP